MMWIKDAVVSVAIYGAILDPATMTKEDSTAQGRLVESTNKEV